MKTFDPSGMGVALVTPFNSDKTVDYGAFGPLIDSIIDGGADYLVALGTTAETPTLDPEEKRAVRDFVSQRVAGRVPIVLGMGGNSTVHLVRGIEKTDFRDYSAILTVAPFYNKPSQEGLFRHYEAVCKASPLPVLLYNIPGRTGVNISAETTLRIARSFGNVAGVKEASGNLAQIKEIVDGAPEGFTVVSGDDALTPEIFAAGGRGVISVTGNALPAEFSALVRLCRQGRIEQAKAMRNEMLPLLEALFADGNPAGIKALLSLMGKCRDELRLPLVPAAEATRAALAEAVRN